MNEVDVQMVFSPQVCTLDLLEKTLTPDRRTLAQRLVAQVEAAVKGGGSRHNLVLAPRGMGKTHLLAYVRKTLERRAADLPNLRVIVLSEDEFGLSGLLDFVVACLRAVGVPVTELTSAVPTRGLRAAQEEAVRYFDELIRGQAVVICIENLASVFTGFERNELPRFRAFLQTRPAVSLLASSTDLFTNSDNADHPFYGFFNIHPLMPLDETTTCLFLTQLAAAHGDSELVSFLGSRSGRARVRAVFHLAGGNHRLLAMLSVFLSAEGLDDLVLPFLRMADRELTPYYQQRLGRLSPQQNKILRSIADCHGRAIAVKEIADRCFLTSQVTSRQLRDLRICNLIRSTSVGRESYYELNEPLLRLVLDMKDGRDRPLPMIVTFLRAWFSDDEVVQRFGQSEQPALCEQVARALVNKGYTLGTLNRSEEEIACYDEVVQRFGQSEEPAFREQVALAWLNKAIAQNTAAGFARALELFDAILQLDQRHPKAAVWRIQALLGLGNLSAADKAMIDLLGQPETTGDNRRNLAKSAVEIAHRAPEALALVVRLYRGHPADLAAGLLKWVKSLSRINAARAANLTPSVARLQAAFANHPECALPLQVLTALCRHAQGDRTALMELPLEIRQLVAIT